MIRTRPYARGVVLCCVVAAGVVALVRHAAADAPAGRYTIQSGTVLDTKTGLTWQQGVPAPTYDWSGAKDYCATNTAGLPGTGWRLPSMKELQTIVDESRSNPAIDPSAFPSTPSEVFWTSSPLAGYPSSAWYVYFGSGYANFVVVSSTSRVRCVR